MEAITQPPLRKRKVDDGDDSIPQVESFVGVKEDEDEKLPPRYDYDSSSDDDVAYPPEVYRKILESDGFDLDVRFPNSSFHVFANNEVCRNSPVNICAKVGLHWYNFQNGSNLKLVRVEKYNYRFCSLMHYHITLEAMDPATTNSRVTFQTRVTQAVCKNDEDSRILTEICRIKPEVPGQGNVQGCWNNEAVDVLYKGDLPKWISGEENNNDQFYELSQSEVGENDWLNLYTEIAWGGEALWGRCDGDMPLEITKVVVQTLQDVKPKEKVKAVNAIFYISFKDPTVPPRDLRALVRRSTDGITGHVCLESKCWRDDPNVPI